jgi:hypothetical protein
MEIGSFIELDIRDSGEYYPGNKDIARLNSARAGIFHACRLYNCTKVYLPYYLCSVVKKFLKAKDIEVGFYHISETFEPITFRQEPGSAVVIVNYFGMLSRSTIESIAGKFSLCARIQSGFLFGYFWLPSKKDRIWVRCLLWGPDEE